MKDHYRIDWAVKLLRQSGSVRINQDERFRIAALLENLMTERNTALGSARAIDPGATIPASRALEIVLSRCRMREDTAQDLYHALANARREEET